MANRSTFGRQPTLGEMRDYYLRDDVLDFLYEECQQRNIDMAFRRKRWSIKPTSREHLRELIEEVIDGRIRNAYSSQADPDEARLEKFDYLSFHSRTTIMQGDKRIGFDMILEADLSGWRRSFEDLTGVVEVLDAFGVCYRMKYSGVRSLHLMIPFESLPRTFNGRPMLGQQDAIHKRLRDYFQRYCGMRRAHGGSVLRLAYSLNEDIGLVSVPFTSEELPCFRPWQTHIHNIQIDHHWHGNISGNAGRAMASFLRAIAQTESQPKRRRTMALAIQPRSVFAPRAGSDSLVQWHEDLGSEDHNAQIGAAWQLMNQPDPIPLPLLEHASGSSHPDVRLYLTESLQKQLSPDTLRLAGRLLSDPDQFVRISAVDAFILAGKNPLEALVTNASAAGTHAIQGFSDLLYGVDRAAQWDLAAFRESLEDVGGQAIVDFVQGAIDTNQSPWVIKRTLAFLRELCKPYGIEDSQVFGRAMEQLVTPILRRCAETPEASRLSLPVLEAIRRNEAIPLTAIRGIAAGCEAREVKVPGNRMSPEERALLEGLVGDTLDGLSNVQMARILAQIMVFGAQRLFEPAMQVLLACGREAIAEALPPVLERHDAWIPRVDQCRTVLTKHAPSLADILPSQQAVSEASLAGIFGVDKWIDEMRNGNWGEQRRAIMNLGQSRHPDALPPLIEALGHQREGNRNQAVRALRAFGEAAIPAVKQAAGAGNPALRRGSACAALAYLAGNDAMPLLAAALQDRFTCVRADTAKALGRIREPQAVPALTEALASERSPRVQKIMAQALRHIGTPGALAAAQQWAGNQV